MISQWVLRSAKYDVPPCAANAGAASATSK
jgi:hypothetical protein